MELCEDGHDQVCFDGLKCPVCEELKTVSNLEDKIYDLEKEIEELKDKLEEK
jgi:transcription initiation factor IIE alpha subunit